MARIRDAGMTIVFVNTRAQAELMFQALWRLNEPTLPIALHHGSLEVEQRRRVEAAMAAGKLRAVVATSSLDLGIDWGGVDQVIQVGAPKGVSRLLQRVGRANHRMDEAVARDPGAGQPVRGAGMRGRHARRRGARTGWRSAAARRAGRAGAAPAGAGVLGAVPAGRCICGSMPRRALRRRCRARTSTTCWCSWRTAATRSPPTTAGASCSATARAACTCAAERIARQHRMNIGTIVEAPLVKVRLVGKKRFGPVLGEIEEYFVNLLRPGDTFMFAGRLLRFLRLHENVVECAEGGTGEPMVPAYEGGRLPLTTNLADRVRGLLQSPVELGAVSRRVQDWLKLQKARSRMPGRNDLLVETFPRGDRWYLVAYCFEGRNAHQTLGMLLTRRMERAGLLRRWASSPPTTCWASGRPSSRAMWRSCSIRTCWATIWRHGWRKAPCCGGHFAMSR